jgi:hypothetical protein
MVLTTACTPTFGPVKNSTFWLTIGEIVESKIVNKSPKCRKKIFG